MTLLVFFLVPLALLLLAMMRKKKEEKKKKPPLPPGPPGLPVIGNMRMMDQLTHRGLAKLAKEYGGLLYLRLGSLDAVAVSTADIARQVLQAQDGVFSNRPATIAISYLTYDRADMAFANYGPFWRQMRKLCVVKLFSRKRAESWDSVRQEVDATIASVAGEAGRETNVGEVVFNLTKNIVFRAAFGSKSDEEQDEFIAILQEFSRLFGAFNAGDFIPWLRWVDPQGINRRLRKARESLDRFIDRIIDEHMAKGGSGIADDPDADMVDDMLAFFDDGAAGGGGGDDELQASLRLTRNNIKAMIMDVMFGGTETVASAIEWVMAELLRNPAELRRVQEELAEVVGLDRKVRDVDLEKLHCLKLAVKETLRLHPPIPLLLHAAAEDSTLSGFFVPARSRVMVNVWAVGRDPGCWGEDAGEFRPSRFEAGGAAEGVDFRGNFFELLPFGSGRRSCPGMQLGLYATETAVAQLLHCFRWELPKGMKQDELDMGDVFGLTAPRAVRLVAVATPRLTCPVSP